MMKKECNVIFMFLGMAAMVILVSCTMGNNNVERGFIFTAILEDSGNKSSDGPYGEIKWTAGDAFKVAQCDGEGNTYHFNLMTGSGKNRAFFYTSNFKPEHNHTAAYPYDAATIMGRTVVFDIPNRKDIGSNVGVIPNKTNPMVAVTTGNNFHFKSIFGGVGIPLFGNDNNIHVSDICLTSLDTCEALWGTCTAIISGEDEDATITSTTTNEAIERNTVTLACDVDLSLSSEAPTWFYVMLPPGTLASGFKLEVLDGSEVLVEKETTSPVAVVERKKVKYFNPIMIEDTFDDTLPSVP